MNNRDIFDRLRPLASRLSKGAGKKPAQRASARPARSAGTAQTPKKAPARPVTRRELIYTGWSAAILLCILLSVFAMLFASCSSAEAEPGESAPIESSALPDGSEPPAIVSPAA